MQEQIGIDDLLKRRPERLYELSRQVPYESDGVGEHNLTSVCEWRGEWWDQGVANSAS